MITSISSLRHPPGQDVMSRIRTMAVRNTYLSDFKRIKDAICIESNVPSIYPEHLSKDDLRKMAKYVNNTYIHYSANCALLSSCLHYNIFNRQDILSSQNISSPTLGFEEYLVDQVVFGEQLNRTHYLNSIDEVQDEILKYYTINGEDSFIISTENYTVPIVGECAHNFNAVVLCDDNHTPQVQFIDSWKTSNPLPTLDEIKSRYPSSATFYMRYHNETFDC
ncbi:T3SS effector cysteine hydrolase SpvD family protein [Edwardsiella ictaluri]|uniref:T3SS effector cysteine hydrolase SpvD family protein n=1 Tax=Edwardsiella ictaluri TaxID=67780 RepID=UPI0009C18CBD|nr:T3SS effector cysteine hydrolase SpvD family protein [Edwardsiella ictaluri]ARD38133.1 virulence protein SpvD [Edwardsiella ictaluri]QPW26549.1 T3SS effector cysteine hydrolase SpvD family protein [Edwardsiella ictaluri]